jgi:hypothetical protein
MPRERYYLSIFHSGIILEYLYSMKTKVLASLVLSLATVWAVQAQSADVIVQVKETIKAGSAKELAQYLSETVEVTIEEKVNSYSRAQAEFALRDFFKAHPPAEFNIIHQGQSKGGQPFAIGQYKSGGVTYRVWMKIKTADKQQLIQEISFVKE